jgi:catechol 2,3-dioxygenase-like lactoylglutathione lyase family enzyme
VLVDELEASAAFYEDVLRLQPLATPWGPAAPIRFFALGGGRQLHMGVSDRRAEPDRNLHLAFAVSDFDAYLGFLRERGIRYTNFRGSSDDPQLRPDGVRQVYLQDPDGNWLEINDAAHPQP